MRIAVVDDEELYLQDVCLKIEKLKQSYDEIVDMEVDTFHQGKDFLKAFRLKPYDSCLFRY